MPRDEATLDKRFFDVNPATAGNAPPCLNNVTAIFLLQYILRLVL